MLHEVNDTTMHLLNIVTIQFTTSTNKTNKRASHFMDYCASNSDNDLQQKIDLLSTTLDQNQLTTISFDIKSIYTSIKYTLVEKVVDYFSANLSIDESTTIRKCL